jgi:hypothetical protein
MKNVSIQHDSSHRKQPIQRKPYWQILRRWLFCEGKETC